MATYGIRPRNPAHSILIQLALIKLGYRWTHFGDTNVRNMNMAYLVIQTDLGLIDCNPFNCDYDEITFERGVFCIKHSQELVVNSRIKWRDQIVLNKGLIGNHLLNEYRAKRNSNQFRTNSSVEQICEYTLYLEDQVRELRGNRLFQMHDMLTSMDDSGK